MPASDFNDLIRLSFFTDVAKAIVSETTVKGVLDRLMNCIGESFTPLNWSVLLLDHKTDQLVFRIAVGKAADTLVGVRIPANEGVAGWVASHGCEVIIEDVASDSRFSSRIDDMTGFLTESIIAVPLKSGNKVFGVIELINKLDGSHFTPLEMKALATIADFSAIAIEKAMLLRQTKWQAMTDPLTGLLNRRGLGKALKREQARIKRYGGSLAFILADVDDFKSINDSRGHVAGDVVLKTVAKTLLTTCRESDSIARLGGDEFLVALPYTEEGTPETARERLSEAIREAAKTCQAGPFSVSLGIHSGSVDTHTGHIDLAKLIEESDRDLYRRKESKSGSLLQEDIMAAMDDESRHTGSGLE